MKINRIIRSIPASGAAVLLIAGVALAEPLPGGTLNPIDIPKFVTPLVIPPAMPRTDKLPAKMAKSTDYYEIAVREIEQQILPEGSPLTTLWGYGSVNHPGSFNYPAYTIEAKVNKPVRVKWINDLVKDPVACAASANKLFDEACNYIPHFLPVDQTLHWANPSQDCIDMPGMMMTDCRGSSQDPYVGPVPMIAHLHGAHVGEESDGYPEAWYLPAANNIPYGFASEGSHFGQIAGQDAIPGQAVFQYPNDQRATTLWFHDHTLGMTRLNVYAGPAGFYLLRGGSSDMAINAKTGKAAVLPGPAPALGDPAGIKYYEIPVIIQDRSFNADGSLFYPDNRAFFEGLEPGQLQIPFIPDQTLAAETSDVSPKWNPEFFGNTLVVNGKTWPSLTVDQRQYRLRFLNGSDSRFLILKLAVDNNLTEGIEDGDYTVVAGQFWQIGADGGYLPAPVQLNELLLGPAERADVIINFKNLPPGKLYLVNQGPDEPFGGGSPCPPLENPTDNPGCGDFAASDPFTTGQVMLMNVVASKGTDPSTPVANLILPARMPLGAPDNTRKLSLNEDESGKVFVEVDGTGEYVFDGNGNLVEVAADAPNGAPFGPTSARLGTIDTDNMPMPMDWMMAISETPAVNETEIWEIYNFTMDAHPIHIHQVQFEIVDRQTLEVDADGMAMAVPTGDLRGPQPWETGTKDTVIVYPGELARVKAKFDLPGLFVWHCHILSHEDNEMMRPICVGGNCP